MRPDLSRNSDPELLGAPMAGAKMRAFDFALDVLDIDPRKLHAWLAMTRSGDQPRSRDMSTHRPITPVEAMAPRLELLARRPGGPRAAHGEFGMWGPRLSCGPARTNSKS